MKILLLHGHKAVVIDDGENVVSVEPKTDGTLVLGGETFPIKNGEESPTFGEKSQVNAVFIVESGIEYEVLSPRVYKGVLTTRLDPYAAVLEQRLHIDRLENELELAREEISKLRGSMRYDSLGFLEI